MKNIGVLFVCGEISGRSRATVVRLLGDAERLLGVCIEYEREGFSTGYGEYRLIGWGVLDKRRVIAG